MNSLRMANFEEEQVVPELIVVNNDLALISDIGRRKKTNQDYGIVAIRNDETVIMIVADGVSNSQSASLAAQTACETVYSILYNSNDFNEKLMKKAIHMANEEVNKLPSSFNTNLDDPETTIVVALRQGNQVILGWVGDSRAYAVGNHRVELLTEDDSWCNKVIKAGIMSAAEAKEHPRSHIITQCLGIKNTLINVHTSKIKLKSDEGLLLCTDGLYNMTDILPNSWKNPANIEAWLLVCNANRGGGIDNITIAISKA